MNTIIENQQELAEWVRAQTGRVDLAVAFWGEGADQELGLVAGRKVRILLDLEAGASNPDVVERLRDTRGITVKQYKRLHAKLYLGAEELVIGSANASANGLGVEGCESAHWTELSLRTSDPVALKQAADWFKRKWSAGKPIKDADLAAARAAWKQRRKNRPVESRDLLTDVAAKRPEEMADRNIYVNVSTEAMSKVAEKMVRAAEKVAGQELFAYEYWPGIPIDAVMVSFWAPPKGRIEWDEPRVQKTPAERRRSRLKFVTSTKLEGFDVGKLADWIPRIKYYRDHPAYGRAWRRDSGLCLELSEFVALTQPAVRA